MTFDFAFSMARTGMVYGIKGDNGTWLKTLKIQDGKVLDINGEIYIPSQEDMLSKKWEKVR